MQAQAREVWVLGELAPSARLLLSWWKSRSKRSGGERGRGTEKQQKALGLVGMATSQRPKIIPGIKPCDRQRFHPSIHSPANRGEITPICPPALPFTLHEYGACSCTPPLQVCNNPIRL